MEIWVLFPDLPHSTNVAHWPLPHRVLILSHQTATARVFHDVLRFTSVLWCFSSGLQCFTMFHTVLQVFQCFMSVSRCSTMFSELCKDWHQRPHYLQLVTARLPITTGIGESDHMLNSGRNVDWSNCFWKTIFKGAGWAYSASQRLSLSGSF